MTITTNIAPPEPLIPEKQVERDFGLTDQHLRYCRLKGDHPPYYKRGRRYFYRHSEVDAWLHKSRIAAPATAAGGTL